jgi:hypothetical protein
VFSGFEVRSVPAQAWANFKSSTLAPFSSWGIPSMARVGLIVAIVVVAALLIGVVGLAVWDPPAPSAQIEKTIPNERFQR